MNPAPCRHSPTSEPLRFRHSGTGTHQPVRTQTGDETPRAYRFGEYRIDPAARELRRNDRLLSLPRRVFDGLAYLVEHRERAVGHDELISALWGRVDVANAQVSQLIMQVRRAVGDESHTQHSVRTIAGFGYRWVVPTEGISEATDPPDAKGASPAAAAEAAPSDAAVVPPADRDAPSRRPLARRLSGTVQLLLLLVAAALLATAWRMFVPRSLANASGEAVVILPFDIDAPEDVDADWVRLGVMDLVAGRLRRAGLPVPPSDGVVAAVHASAALPEAERADTLRRTLGANLLIHADAAREFAHRQAWIIDEQAQDREIGRIEEFAWLVEGIAGRFLSYHRKFAPKNWIVTFTEPATPSTIAPCTVERRSPCPARTGATRRRRARPRASPGRPRRASSPAPPESRAGPPGR